MTGNAFTGIFGGSTVQPSNVSYLHITLTASVVLSWPTAQTPNTLTAARIMDISSVTSDFTITMPAVEGVSNAAPGQDALFRNVGSAPITILKNDGSTLCVVNVTPNINVIYIYVTDNTTQGGTWGVVNFGAGTSSADAATLAGYGLTALASTLNLNNPVANLSNSYSLEITDRATTFVWKGGAGTFSLLPVNIAGNGFPFLLHNDSIVGGTLTLVAASNNTIDGAATEPIAPGQSAWVISDGANNWFTVGLGQPTFFVFGVNALSVAGNENVTLTSGQAADIMQIYSGVLTGNIVVIAPETAAQYYVINNTTGNFTLGFQIGSDGDPIDVAQDTGLTLITDGTDLYQIPTQNANIISIGEITPATGTLALGSAGAWSGLSIGPNNYVLTSNSTTASWQPSASGAPASAAYLLPTANGSLPDAVILGALATGLLKVTTTTGIISTAVANTDYIAPGAGSITCGGLIINPSGSASMYIATSSSQTIGSSGAIFWVLNGSIPMITSDASQFTGKIVTSTSLGNASQGELLVGNSSGGYTPLPIGATGESLISTGTTLEWVPNYSGGGAGANIIIGGDFNANPFQRYPPGNLYTVTAPTNTSAYAPDMFAFASLSASSGPAFTYGAYSGAPTFAQSGVYGTQSLAVTATTGQAVIAANDSYNIVHRVEGYNISPFYGATLTLSFWVYATVSGIYSVSLSNSGADRTFVAEYTITTGATWQFVSITIGAPPSGGTWNFTNGIGLKINWALATGSTYQTSTIGSWIAGASSALGSVNQVNSLASNGNVFVINYVQLEVGNEATAFEVQSVQETLTACQRYYQKTYNVGVKPGTVTNIGRYLTTAGAANFSSSSNVPVTYPRCVVAMRAAPTVAFYSALSGTLGSWTASAETGSVPSNLDFPVQANNIGENGFDIQKTGTVTPWGGPTFVWGHYTASASL